jgi:molybdopterin synthase catalytic subunit
MQNIKIVADPLNIENCIAWVSTQACGAINVFIGTVRDETKEKRVVQLKFEAYEKMALSEMKKIADTILHNWPIHKILIHHRTGTLQVGEVPVVIAASATHRDAAFEACRYAIDTLKQTVPIWKKEFFEDGELWVAAHP